MCHKIAVEDNVAHAQLPIKNFVKLQSRTVLTVNHGKYCSGVLDHNNVNNAFTNFETNVSDKIFIEEQRFEADIASLSSSNEYFYSLIELSLRLFQNVYFKNLSIKKRYMTELNHN